MTDARGGPSRWVAGAALLTALLSQACAEDVGHSWLLFDADDRTSIPIPTARPAPGSGEGSSWMAGASIPLDQVGRIRGARVWGDSLVTLFDNLSCQAHLLRLHPEGGAERIRRVGRCGEGPGELRGGVDVYLDRDTLIVAEHDRNLLTFYATDGSGFRSLRVELAGDDRWRVSDILHASDQTLLLNGSVGPGLPSGKGLVRAIDRESGSIGQGFLADAPAAEANRAPVLRQAFLCADTGAEQLVVANRWRLERAFLSLDGHLRSGPFISGVDWVAEVPFEDQPGYRPTAFVRVARGGGLALMAWRTLGDEPGTIDRYYIEVLDARGQVLHQEHGRRPGPDHSASMTIA